MAEEKKKGFLAKLPDKIFGGLEKLGIPKILSIFLFFFALLAGIILSAPRATIEAIVWLFRIGPLWMPPVLAVVFWQLWIRYIRAKFIAGQEHILLEVRIPRDIMKSPRAMEAVFDGLAFASGEATFIQRWIKGSVRPWWSFELASLEGRVHFFIWTRKGLKEQVESQIYSQFPEVEIYIVEDYARKVLYDPSKHSVWGCDFVLSGKDAYPIKTYIDYELDKDPKEEYKIDPISNLFEFLSSIGPGEQVWLQVLIRAAKGGENSAWKAEAQAEIDEIRKKATPKFTDDSGKERTGIPNPTPGQTDKIRAIERSLGKYAFQAGIRGVYVAESGSFKAVRITGLTGIFRQFSSANLNGFKPTRWHTEFNYPWQDFRGIRKRGKSKKILEAYLRRSWFHPPDQEDPFILTSEELATIYHFPSRVVQAPGLARIPSTKSEAPPNLPI